MTAGKIFDFVLSESSEFVGRRVLSDCHDRNEVEEDERIFQNVELWIHLFEVNKEEITNVEFNILGKVSVKRWKVAENPGLGYVSNNGERIHDLN